MLGGPSNILADVVKLVRNKILDIYTRYRGSLPISRNAKEDKSLALVKLFRALQDIAFLYFG